MGLDEPLLRAQVRRSADGVVLVLVGEADIATEPRLRLRLGDLLADRDLSHLVVDAAALSFLDVSCLKALLAADAVLRERGGRLVLRSPSSRVRRLLSVLQVDLPVER